MKLTPTQLGRAIPRNGRIFSVIFIKRTTGTVRHMVARTGVTKYLRGGKLRYKPSGKSLMVVFDMQKMGYRTIDLDGMIALRSNHHIFTA